jgi:hypothetical protein
VVGGQATARRPKLRLERRRFLAPEAVIFGANFTGPQILVVNTHLDNQCEFHPRSWISDE